MQAEQLEVALIKHKLSSAPDLLQRLEAMQEKASKQEAVRIAAKELKASKATIFRDELKARMRVRHARLPCGSALA